MEKETKSGVVRKVKFIKERNRDLKLDNSKLCIVHPRVTAIIGKMIQRLLAAPKYIKNNALFLSW